MSEDEKYAYARIALDGAMAEFFEAARKIGMSHDEIANDVCDSLFDGSDGEIKMDANISA